MMRNRMFEFFGRYTLPVIVAAYAHSTPFHSINGGLAAFIIHWIVMPAAITAVIVIYGMKQASDAAEKKQVLVNEEWGRRLRDERAEWREKVEALEKERDSRT